MQFNDFIPETLGKKRIRRDTSSTFADKFGLYYATISRVVKKVEKKLDVVSQNIDSNVLARF